MLSVQRKDICSLYWKERSAFLSYNSYTSWLSITTTSNYLRTSMQMSYCTMIFRHMDINVLWSQITVLQIHSQLNICSDKYNFILCTCHVHLHTWPTNDVFTAFYSSLNGKNSRFWSHSLSLKFEEYCVSVVWPLQHPGLLALCTHSAIVCISPNLQSYLVYFLWEVVRLNI